MDPHTRAKHQILEEYLKAWFPILSQRSGRILYLDGFAGPGIYKGGEEGSPVIAIRTAVEHSLLSHFNEILFYFIEKDKERAATLGSLLKGKFPVVPGNLKYFVFDAEFAPTLESVLDNIKKSGASLAPTLAFLDPFGFSGLPMDLIARMLAYRKCEVLVTFMAGFVNRFNDELREQALDELFATKDWRKVRQMSDTDQRQRFLLALYTDQLRQVAGAEFVRTFEVRGKNNQLIYFLVFATSHLKGVEVMKGAMLKVDRRGTYKFSDYTDANQNFLIDYSTDNNWMPAAANMIFHRFKGSTVDVSEVRNFVLAETPFLFRSSLLKLLEQSDPQRLVGVAYRKKAGTYPDGCSLTFGKA